MRIFYATILLVLLSCHDKWNTKKAIPHNRFSFKLIDSLGTVSIDFPERTDSFFRWIQESDCGKPCEHGDYRFQSKRNPIFPESGFFWIGEPEDSVDQLSIYHQRPYKLLKKNDTVILHDLDLLREKVLSDPGTANVISDTVVKIDNRYFYVFKVADFNRKNGVRARRLIAFTTISGTLIEFDYKLLTTHYDTILTRFFDNSLKNLETVRLIDGG